MTPSEPRVLIVDDDLDIREALSDVLEDLGYGVLTAENGLEALTLLRNSTALPSAILLDLMMPILDGYGFLEECEKDAVLASIPVAIITAGHGADPGRLPKRAPIVPKPLDVARLVSTLYRLRRAAGAPP